MVEVADLSASMTRMEEMLQKMNEILDRFNGVSGAMDDATALPLPLPSADADSVPASGAGAGESAEPTGVALLSARTSLLQATSVIRSSSSTTSSTPTASSSLAPASDVTSAASATAPTNSMKTNFTSSTPMVFGLGTPGAATAYVCSTSISTAVHVTCSTKGPDHTTNVPVPICLTANKKIIKKLFNTKTLLKKHDKDLVGQWLEDMKVDKAKVAAGTLVPHNITTGNHQASPTSLLPSTTPALTSTPTPVASSEQDHASDAPTTYSILGCCIDADTGQAAVTSQIEVYVLHSVVTAPSVEAEVPSDLSIMFLTQGSSHDIVYREGENVVTVTKTKEPRFTQVQCSSKCCVRKPLDFCAPGQQVQKLIDNIQFNFNLELQFHCGQFRQPWPPPRYFEMQAINVQFRPSPWPSFYNYCAAVVHLKKHLSTHKSTTLIYARLQALLWIRITQNVQKISQRNLFGASAGVTKALLSRAFLKIDVVVSLTIQLPSFCCSEAGMQNGQLLWRGLVFLTIGLHVFDTLAVPRLSQVIDPMISHLSVPNMLRQYKMKIKLTASKARHNTTCADFDHASMISILAVQSKAQCPSRGWLWRAVIFSLRLDVIIPCLWRSRLACSSDFVFQLAWSDGLQIMSITLPGYVQWMLVENLKQISAQFSVEVLQIVQDIPAPWLSRVPFVQVVTSLSCEVIFWSDLMTVCFWRAYSMHLWRYSVNASTKLWKSCKTNDDIMLMFTRGIVELQFASMTLCILQTWLPEMTVCQASTIHFEECHRGRPHKRICKLSYVVGLANGRLQMFGKVVQSLYCENNTVVFHVSKRLWLGAERTWMGENLVGTPGQCHRQYIQWCHHELIKQMIYEQSFPALWDPSGSFLQWHTLKLCS